MKDEDISNRTLALLLGVAIIVSLVGILGSKSSYVAYTLTGYATDQNATVGAEVTRVIAITVAGAIAFGSGYIFQNNSEQAILLNSTGGDLTSNRCAPANTTFAGATCTMADDTDNKITVRNDGNVNVTILMDINTTAASLGLGTGGDIGFLLGQEESATVGAVARPACLSENGTTYRANDSTTGAAFFGNDTGLRSANNNGAAVSFYGVKGKASGSSQVKICSKLQPDDNYDLMNVTIYMNVSKSTPTGSHNYLLNFTAVDFGDLG